MRILAVDRHFWPDHNPYSVILRMIASGWVQDGHQVTVYTAQPSYNNCRNPQLSTEVMDGVAIHRVRLLPEQKQIRWLWAVNSLYFLLRASWFAIRRRDVDLLVGATSLPILNALALRLISLVTGIPYVIHAQDIHPEAAACVGKLRQGIIFRWLRFLDVRSHQRAEQVVAISFDQRNAIAERGVARQRINVIHNPPLDHEGSSLVETNAFSTGTCDNRYCVLFAGNIGHFQGLDLILEAAQLLREDRQIKFVFLGDGLAKILKRAGDLVGETVFFVPRLSVASTFAAMSRADLGVVSLAPGLYRLAFPSKTMMYLSAGCPVLAVIESESELAEIVRSNRLGVAVDGFTGKAVAAAILDAKSMALGTSLPDRNRIQSYCDQRFGRDRMAVEWRKLLSQLQARLSIKVVPATPTSRVAA